MGTDGQHRNIWDKSTVVFFIGRHARVQGILEGYLMDMWRKFGGHVDEFWKKCVGNLEEIKRRSEVKNLIFKNLIFQYPYFKKAPVCGHQNSRHCLADVLFCVINGRHDVRVDTILGQVSRSFLDLTGQGSKQRKTREK